MNHFVSLFDSVLAGAMVWAALTNINAITRRTCISILVVNLLLGIGALCTAVSPFYGLDMNEVGHALIDLALVGLMIYGRREADRFAPRGH